MISGLCYETITKGNSNGLFHRPRAPTRAPLPPSPALRAAPRGDLPRGNGAPQPALLAAGPQSRAAGHGQAGWLVTGTRRGCEGGLIQTL